MNNNIIYLDNAAHHPLLPAVQSKIIQTLPLLANPSSLHSMGVKLRNEIETSREKIARVLNCDTNEIIFTSGASESNSTIAHNFEYFSNRDMGISPFEHDSVYGYDDCGCLDFHILVGNENGKDYRDIIKNYLLFGVDATAALGNIQIDLYHPNFYMASFSGEKTGSISGSGLLYVNREYQKYYTPMVYGHQENNRRGGTENTLGIIGMGISIPYAVAHLEKKHEHCLKLKKTLLDGLSGVDFICNSGDDCVPSIVSLSFKGIDGAGLMYYLDSKGICVSNGSACNSGDLEPSKVLKALGVPEDYIKGTIRISTSLNNTVDEIKYTVEKIKEYIELVG